MTIPQIYRNNVEMGYCRPTYRQGVHNIYYIKACMGRQIILHRPFCTLSFMAVMKTMIPNSLQSVSNSRFYMLILYQLKYLLGKWS